MKSKCWNFSIKFLYIRLIFPKIIEFRFELLSNGNHRILPKFYKINPIQTGRARTETFHFVLFTTNNPKIHGVVLPQLLKCEPSLSSWKYISTRITCLRQSNKQQFRNHPKNDDKKPYISLFSLPFSHIYTRLFVK